MLIGTRIAKFSYTVIYERTLNVAWTRRDNYISYFRRYFGERRWKLDLYRAVANYVVKQSSQKFDGPWQEYTGRSYHVDARDKIFKPMPTSRRANAIGFDASTSLKKTDKFIIIIDLRKGIRPNRWWRTEQIALQFTGRVSSGA